ncbi:MAG: VWA domain-containing protein [Pseudomonadota bacterium]
MGRRSRLNAFSLSFLDIMSCGFGAVVLFFMIINNESRVRAEDAEMERLSEVTRLELAVDAQTERLAQVRNTLSRVVDELDVAQGRSAQLISRLEITREELALLEEKTSASRENVNKLTSDLQSVDDDAERLRVEAEGAEFGNARRAFEGDGQRQYLTGLRLDGERVLILLDASSSMLDETIVNVIRRRNMSDEDRKSAPKWQRAVRTVEWLIAQLPTDTTFQLYAFNTLAQPTLQDTGGNWLGLDEATRLEEVVNGLKTLLPNGGTSLYNAFLAAREFDEPPDNIILITDGLPTQGRSPPRRATVTARQRLKHFEDAIDQLPNEVPVNIILFPFEGDPRASSAFWQLAQYSAGSIMAPSRDWP